MRFVDGALRCMFARYFCFLSKGVLIVELWNLLPILSHASVVSPTMSAHCCWLDTLSEYSGDCMRLNGRSGQLTQW